mgnify:CR=1 FL=1
MQFKVHNRVYNPFYLFIINSVINIKPKYFQNYIFKEVFDICRKYNNNFNNTA